MKRIFALGMLAGGVAMFAGLGCNSKPAPPRTANWERVKLVSIAEGNATELAAVKAVETARVNYRYRLEVLKNYLLKVGKLDKFNCAEREIKNLDEVQTFRWDGIEVIPPAGESIAHADERLLVESVVAARRKYVSAVAELQALYARRGDAFKAKLVKNMQDRFDPIRTYMYFMEAEVPPADLKPTKVVPEADRMYEDALSLHRWGKILPLVTDYNKQRRALMLLTGLIDKHPNSTKIALAAYYIADIYKEYFNEDLRAVYWYQRAWQWDPNITKPARFQAAVTWDMRLKNRAKAVELYRQVIQHEQFNRSNVGFAERRIAELTGQKAK